RRQRISREGTRVVSLNAVNTESKEFITTPTPDTRIDTDNALRLLGMECSLYEQILRLRMDDMTDKEIAGQRSLSEKRVNRIRGKAERRLRELLASYE